MVFYCPTSGEGIRHCGSIENWHGMGDAGLVYDSQRKLVKEGVEEYAKSVREEVREMIDEVLELSGLRSEVENGVM